MEQRIEVPAEWDNIATLMDFTDAAESAMPMTGEQAYILRLVIEEIATNIIKYGYDDSNRGTIQLHCACEGGTLRVTVRDRGRPFDPREAPDPDLDADVAHRHVGGLGVFLVREFADTIDYAHDAETGWNELTVIKGQ